VSKCSFCQKEATQFVTVSGSDAQACVCCGVHRLLLVLTWTELQEVERRLDLCVQRRDWALRLGALREQEVRLRAALDDTPPNEQAFCPLTRQLHEETRQEIDSLAHKLGKLEAELMP
jgi:hypothetical protein